MTEIALPAAWVWFHDPRAIRVGDTTYLTWYNAAGIHVGAYHEPSRRWDTFRLMEEANVLDDHDVAALGFRSDGRLIAAYSEHNDAFMRVRISTNPYDVTAWGDEFHVGAQGVITYPNLVHLSAEGDEERGRWYLFYRQWATGGGEPTFVTSDDDGDTWTAETPITADTGERPYVKVASNGIDRIDFLLSDGHPNEFITSVLHVSYRGGEWLDTSGSAIGPLPLDIGDMTVISDGQQVNGWIWDIALDMGVPVAVFVVFPTDDDHRYMYARPDDAGVWQASEIAAGGDGIANDRSIYASGGVVLDHAQPSVVYASVQDGPTTWAIRRLVIGPDGLPLFSTTVSDGGKNMRPVVVRGDNRVLWMQGEYAHFTDFDTHMRASPPLLEPEADDPGEITDLPGGVASPTVTWLACDLITGDAIADLFDVTGPISRLLGAYTSSDLTLPIPLSGPGALGDLAVQATTPGRTMLVAVVNDQPAWAGMVLTRSAGTDATMRIGTASLESYLNRRRVRDHEWNGADEATIAAGLLADAGDIPGVGTGIGLEIDAPLTGTPRSRTYHETDRATVYDRLRELSAVQGGPEWTIELLWADEGRTRVRKVVRVRKRIGIPADAPQAVFETTAASVFASQSGNEARYSFDEDYSDARAANYVIAYAPGEGDDQPASAPAIDAIGLASGWPIYERHWQPSSSITNTAVLDDHARHELALRKNGASTWAITARWNVTPRLNLDWRLGDDVGWILTGHRHPGGVTGQGRVIGWEMDPAAGTVKPTLLDPGSNEVV